MAAPVSTPFSISMLMIFFIATFYQAYAQLPQPSPRQTTSVFYLQDVATGPNATVAAVTGLKGKDWNYDSFGTIFVVDDPVTVSPGPTSQVVGRAQGLLVVSSHDAATVNVLLSVVFNKNSQHNGSTLEIQGISRQRENYKELSVVSGTGQFRFVRGYAALQTATYDPQTTHSIVRLTITIQT